MSKILMKMLDDSLLFEEHSTKWAKNFKKEKAQRRWRLNTFLRSVSTQLILSNI